MLTLKVKRESYSGFPGSSDAKLNFTHAIFSFFRCDEECHLRSNGCGLFRRRWNHPVESLLAWPSPLELSWYSSGSRSNMVVFVVQSIGLSEGVYLTCCREALHQETSSATLHCKRYFNIQVREGPLRVGRTSVWVARENPSNRFVWGEEMFQTKKNCVSLAPMENPFIKYPAPIDFLVCVLN